MWNDLVTEFLQQGQWTEQADDNADREALTQDFLRRLVKAYVDKPDEQDGKRALGLFVLALGVAEWGVRDPAGLDDKDGNGKAVDSDPAHRHWASDSSGDSGKHLMAYSIGGIGISHADEDEFVAFVKEIAKFPELIYAQRKELLRVIEPSLYKDAKVKFDQLRAASVCREGEPILGKDLFGEPFHHHGIGGGAKYCARFFGSHALQARDWLVFRTWSRLAMRRRDIQQMLLEQWMKKYWDKSLAQMTAGEGREEEAFANVRFRNSASTAANNFCAPQGASVEARISHQMKRYHEVSGDRVIRRVDIMQRPIALYRKYTGKSPIQKFKF